MPQPQTLSAGAQRGLGGVQPAKSSIRFRSADVRRPKVGIVAHVVLASCTCPDQTWRDRGGKFHFCKHIVWVYANRQKALRRGRTRFTVKSLDPQRAAAGITYTVTAFTCHRPDGERCSDWRPGVVELCEHLREVYEEAAGFSGQESRTE